jgi:hypothetical protein
VWTIDLVADNGVTAPTPLTLTLTVDQAPTISGPSAATITAGQPLSSPITFAYAGWPSDTVHASGLPAGLRLTYSDGTATISGTPSISTRSGTTATVTVTAMNKLGSASQAVTLTVDP